MNFGNDEYEVEVLVRLSDKKAAVEKKLVGIRKKITELQSKKSSCKSEEMEIRSQIGYLQKEITALESKLYQINKDRSDYFAKMQRPGATSDGLTFKARPTS